jgi:transposase
MDATPITTLPDDPAMLKELLMQERAARAADIEQIKREAARDREIIKEEATNQIETMKQKHQAEVESLLRRFYGPKSERFDPRQLLMFGVVIDSMPLDEQAIEAESGEKLTTRRIQHKHGRAKLPESLPRIPIEHDLKAEEKLCPCCGLERCRIGQEVSEQLEYVPASFKVLQHIRFKYACKPCNQGCAKCDGKAQIEVAPKPVQPIEKGLPGPGLLAYVITGKLADHLPLYRLESIFARLDVHIARSTMCAWIAAAAMLVRPLADLMATRVRQSQVIHTDETRIPVKECDEAGRCKNGRMWTYIGDEANPYICYDYTPDRTRAGPTRWLDKYKGYLQADAYGGYDGIYAGGSIIEVACWAHARRKFFDAKDTDGKRSAEMLAMVGELYAVENQAKAKIAEVQKAMASATGTEATALSADQRYAIIRDLRQEFSVPILAKIKAWLDVNQKLVLPRSPMAQAIAYVLNQWEALNVYTTQGYLNIDNNAAERALKRIAIGRKNWLFAGHDEAAKSAAILTTLIASAQRHGVDPQAYLTGILARIPATPMSQLEQFLPERFRCAYSGSPR